MLPQNGREFDGHGILQILVPHPKWVVVFHIICVKCPLKRLMLLFRQSQLLFSFDQELYPLWAVGGGKLLVGARYRFSPKPLPECLIWQDSDQD